MKNTALLTSLIATGLLLASPASAASVEPFGGPTVDTSGHIIYDLDKTAFVGTGLAVARPSLDAYNGFTSGNHDIDQSGFAIGRAGPERGQGDNYGWVVHDLSR